MSAPILLAAPVRTPVGAFNGAFAEVPATTLGSAVIRAAIERSGVSFDDIDEVVFGNVISAGLGQNPARQAAIGAGLPVGVGATTVNKVCGSGLKAVMLAAQAIACGDAQIVVAGGMENMSRAPYLLDKARTGYRLGHGQLIDSMIRDGLWDAYNDLHMGACADRCAAEYKFSRKEQDDFAIASFQRAIAAAKSGAFADEIVSVDVPSGGMKRTVAEDEGPRRFNEEKLRQLKPAFTSDGTVTAGNASSINDGAAAVVVLSSSAAESRNVRPVARILGSATASREPEWFTIAPIDAVRRLLKMLSMTVGDVDLFEINEAFAVVTLAAMRELKIPHEKVNVFGGAVALGHPIGASGTRTLVTLLNALRRLNKKIGVVTVCIGGGEAVAMAVERV